MMVFVQNNVQGLGSFEIEDPVRQDQTEVAMRQARAKMGTRMLKRPKVLLIQTQAENAGAQEISRLLGEELEQRDYDIHHMFFYRRTEAFDHQPNTTFCVDERPGSPLVFAKFMFRLVTAIREIKPDVVLTFQHYGNLFGAPAARLAGVRHVIANQVSAQATMNNMIRRLDKLFGRFGMFDVITVNSADTANEYAGFPKAYTDRMVHIPHGFRDKSSSLSKEQARALFDLPQDVPLLGTVARLNRLKRLDVGISALTHNPDWHLVLGGQGPDEARLRQLAGDLGVTDRVHFTGEMQSDYVGNLLRAMDVFLFPSEAETFGLAAVEAAQSGLPMVVNDIPVLREVLQTAEGPCALFASSENPQSYVEPIRRLLQNKAEAKRLTASASHLKELYSMDAMINRYDELLREQLSGQMVLEEVRA